MKFHFNEVLPPQIVFCLQHDPGRGPQTWRRGTRGALQCNGIQACGAVFGFWKHSSTDIDEHQEDEEHVRYKEHRYACAGEMCVSSDDDWGFRVSMDEDTSASERLHVSRQKSTEGSRAKMPTCPGWGGGVRDHGIRKRESGKGWDRRSTVDGGEGGIATWVILHAFLVKHGPGDVGSPAISSCALEHSKERFGKVAEELRVCSNGPIFGSMQIRYCPGRTLAVLSFRLWGEVQDSGA